MKVADRSNRKLGSNHRSKRKLGLNQDGWPPKKEADFKSRWLAAQKGIWVQITAQKGSWLQITAQKGS
jgi:hypothetical protein